MNTNDLIEHNVKLQTALEQYKDKLVYLNIAVTNVHTSNTKKYLDILSKDDGKLAIEALNYGKDNNT